MCTAITLQSKQYILGRCGSVEELKETLLKICIVGLEDPVTQTVAPLH